MGDWCGRLEAGSSACGDVVQLLSQFPKPKARCCSFGETCEWEADEGVANQVEVAMAFVAGLLEGWHYRLGRFICSISVWWCA